EPDAVRRTVGEVATLLADRERRFAAAGLDSMRTYRAARPADDPYGDVFLVVDGWTTLRGDFGDLDAVLTHTAPRGQSHGVTAVATAGRWLDVRPAIRDLFGSRVELRLGDPNDSAVSRRAAANVPERAPGRGITGPGRHLLTLRPELTTAAAPGVAALVKEV